MTNEGWRTRRDAKLARMLDPDEPAWLVSEEVLAADEVVYFNVVHRWPHGGWATRRFTYDMIANVIHFRGSETMDDKELVRLKPDQRIYGHHHLSR